MNNHYSFTADQTTLKCMAKAFLGMMFTRPSVRILYGVGMFVIALQLIAPYAGSGTIVFMLALFLILLPFLSYRNVMRNLQLWGTPGTKITSDFTEDSMTLTTDTATSKIKYSSFQEVRERGSFIFLRPLHSRVWMVVPKELIPDKELARLQNIIPRS